MDAEKPQGHPFQLSRVSLPKGGWKEELARPFEFKIADCCNIAAKKEDRYKNAAKQTLQLMLYDPKDARPPDKRTQYRAIEYQPLKNLRLPEKLEHMTGGTASLSAGCPFVKNTFLLSHDNSRIRPPEGILLTLVDKPTTKVKTNSDGIDSENDPQTIGDWNQLSQVGGGRDTWNKGGQKPLPTTFPKPKTGKIEPLPLPLPKLKAELTKEEEEELDALLEDIF